MPDLLTILINQIMVGITNEWKHKKELKLKICDEKNICSKSVSYLFHMKTKYTIWQKVPNQTFFKKWIGGPYYLENNCVRYLINKLSIFPEKYVTFAYHKFSTNQNSGKK